MSYRDRRIEARFRGEPMLIVTRALEGGRRGPDHEYVYADRGFPEDLGRKMRRYNVTAEVFGEDYDRALLRLLDALERPGPGVYADPELGELQVQIRNVTSTYAKARHGVAIVSFTMVEYAPPEAPSARIDTRAQVDAASDAVAAAAEADFERDFALAGLPQFVADDAVARVGDLAAGVDASAAALDQTTRAAADLALGLADLTADAETLLRAGGFVASARGVFADLAAAAASPASAARALVGLLRFGETAPAILASTAVRRRQALNRVVQTGLIRRLALSEIARAAARQTFDSQEDAEAARDDLIARLDAELILAGGGERAAAGLTIDGAFEDAAYQALAELRARLAEDLTLRAAGLARIVRRTYPSRLPAQVLLYRETGSIVGLDAFVERNGLTVGVRARETAEFLQ
ncbi:MAG: DNA circularization N-terminal domain-containing protein [Pseudomonadota bacterium]